MNKVKMKVSWCFRSTIFATNFAVIRSFFETIRKAKLPLLESIRNQIISPSHVIALA
jgi:hypothetical protein